MSHPDTRPAPAPREEAPADCQCLPASPAAPCIYCDGCRAAGATDV